MEYVEYLEQRVLSLEQELQYYKEGLFNNDSIKNKVYEMAYSKKQYKSFVHNRSQQIAQNWCLCMYCKLYRGDLKNTYIHWRGELETQLGYLNALSLEKPRNRTKMTYEAMITDADMDNSEVVFKSCIVKFRLENENKQNPLGMKIEHQKEVCSLFAENVEDVIDCIGSNDIFTYTRSIFPDDYTPID
jgi:hypothetical protein